MVEKFPLITLSGSPHEIGIEHGRKLKDRIEKTITFYTDVTKKLDVAGRSANAEQILQSAKIFKKVIKQFNPDFSTEIEAIAEGSGTDPLWIYALNARSEIMSNMENASTECTAVYFRETGLLGQNWDWAGEFEDLSVIMRIRKNKSPEILQMTEPGIIGKIGMNSAGLGVTLNFLHQAERKEGLPIHIILRALLEQDNFSDGMDLVRGLPHGQSGNIIFASFDGNYQNIEFAGSMRFFLNNSDTVQTHTNHYLEDTSLNMSDELLQSSYARFNRANILAGNLSQYTEVKMKSILLDRTNSELPICRPYIPGTVMEEVGSVCSIIMNLKQKSLAITHGSPLTNPFKRYNL